MNGGLTREVGGLEVEVWRDGDRMTWPCGEVDLATVRTVRERLGELEGEGGHFDVIPGPAQVQRRFELTGLAETGATCLADGRVR